jgi:plasmid stabilization system protein ParE
MTPLAPAARRQLDALTRYYAERGRVDVIDHLIESIERACIRQTAGRGLFYDSPRPYPTLLRPGWRWTKEGSYWIAFSPGKDGFVIRAIFHEAANIPGRM